MAISAAALSTLTGAVAPITTGLSTASTKSTESSPESQILNHASDGNSFLNKLEKHISDVNHGVGYLSDNVNYDLSRKDAQNGAVLGGANQKAFNYYLGMTSALNYTSRARFVNSVNESTQNLGQIVTPPDEYKKMVDELKAIYGKRVYSEQQKKLAEKSVAK